MNILVTSASRKVGLVQAFQRALAEQPPGGGRVIAVDTNPMSAALFFADERYLVPPSDRADFIPTITDICRRRGVSLLVPTRDEELPLFAAHADSLESEGVFAAVPPLGTVETCQDKLAFVRFCESHGFQVPKTYVGEEASTSPLPLFFRPRTGKGGQGAHIIRSREELEVALARCPDGIVQEVRSDPEYTVDVFADKESQVISVVPRERVFVLAGESYVGRTVRDEAIIRTTSQLAEKLKLVGHATIQCFYGGSEVFFIEVNPRYGGAANLGFAAGASTPHYLVDMVLGRKIKPVVGQFKDQIVMLRYTQDLFMQGDELEVQPWA